MVLINGKVQTYLSNPNWLTFTYNVGGLHLNIDLNSINAHTIRFSVIMELRYKFMENIQAFLNNSIR